MKLGLGTVQFGQDYGLTNKGGQTSANEVKKILEFAFDKKISYLDTAHLYGNSEKVLGAALNHDFRIVTKTPRFADGDSFIAKLNESFQQSLQLLKQKNLYGLLVHNADDLKSKFGKQIYQEMKNLKSEGLVQKIGASVYDGAQVRYILENFEIDIIQVPVNVLDQRLLNDGSLASLKKRGVEIHARSVLLQGLLIAPPETLPAHFDSIKDHLKKYHSFLKDKGMSGLQGALGFVQSLDEVDTVICGVNNLRQFTEIYEASQCETYSFGNTDFSIDDVKILNPSYWEVSHS